MSFSIREQASNLPLVEVLHAVCKFGSLYSIFVYLETGNCGVRFVL